MTKKTTRCFFLIMRCTWSGHRRMQISTRCSDVLVFSIGRLILYTDYDDSQSLSNSCTFRLPRNGRLLLLFDPAPQVVREKRRLSSCHNTIFPVQIQVARLASVTTLATAIPFHWRQQIARSWLEIRTASPSLLRILDGGSVRSHSGRAHSSARKCD